MTVTLADAIAGKFGLNPEETTALLQYAKDVESGEKRDIVEKYIRGRSQQFSDACRELQVREIHRIHST